MINASEIYEHFDNMIALFKAEVNGKSWLAIWHDWDNQHGEPVYFAVRLTEDSCESLINQETTIRECFEQGEEFATFSFSSHAIMSFTGVEHVPEDWFPAEDYAIERV